jgi:multidrug efflux system membrane fusion protein
MDQRSKKPVWTLVGGALLVLVAAGGGYYVAMQQTKSEMQGGAAGAGGPMPGGAAVGQQAMPVPAVVVQPEKIQIWREFSGRLEAVDRADIRPQVSGRIKAILFENGQTVQEGEVIYVIDPRPYKAAFDQAKAAEDTARENMELAEKEYQRARELIKDNAISKRVYDERMSRYETAKAALNRAVAEVEQARLNLDYAYVKAPITGRISRPEITEGNLVEAGLNAPILTSIVSDKGIYVDFEVDEQTYLNHVRQGAADYEGEQKIPVQIQVSSDQSGHVYEGYIQSFDNKIDASSGTIRARAKLPNKNGALLPGMFVTVRMGSADSEEKILISERAIGTNQDRKFVYVIKDGKAEYRAVELGKSMDGMRVVLSGLQGGETVITDGLIKIRPGVPVKPQENSAASGDAGAMGEDKGAPDSAEDHKSLDEKGEGTQEKQEGGKVPLKLQYEENFEEPLEKDEDGDALQKPDKASSSDAEMPLLKMSLQEA